MTGEINNHNNFAFTKLGTEKDITTDASLKTQENLINELYQSLCKASAIEYQSLRREIIRDFGRLRFSELLGLALDKF